MPLPEALSWLPPRNVEKASAEPVGSSLVTKAFRDPLVTVSNAPGVDGYSSLADPVMYAAPVRSSAIACGVPPTPNTAEYTSVAPAGSNLLTKTPPNWDEPSSNAPGVLGK